MSHHDKIEQLNRRLEDLEQRQTAVWERPIFEVARQALLQEIANIGEHLARWGQQRAPVPVAVAGR